MTLTSQNVVAWHDRTPSQLRTLLDQWAAKDFPTLSLTVYGTPQGPRYAATMVTRPVVVATKQFDPLNQAGIQQAFDDMGHQGWGHYNLAATGPANAAAFAGVVGETSPRFVACNAERVSTGDGNGRETRIGGPRRFTGPDSAIQIARSRFPAAGGGRQMSGGADETPRTATRLGVSV
jgi:Polyglycine hydrolase-like, structural repeat